MNKIKTYDHTMTTTRPCAHHVPRPLVGDIERLPHRSNFLATPLTLPTQHTTFKQELNLYKPPPICFHSNILT